MYLEHSFVIVRGSGLSTEPSDVWAHFRRLGLIRAAHARITPPTRDFC